jgi:SWI/SNF-related matrix-associated actin-dependent regulator of chromatin subfamily A3
MSKKLKAASTIIDLTQPETQEPSQEIVPAEVQKFQLFQLTTKIVGKRYYNGKMNDGEIVYLEREPRNPYDANAIKVLSLSRDQVGHIIAKDGTASVLAPIMDYRLKNSAGGDMEAVVISGSSNTFQADVDIVIVGIREHARAIEEMLLVNHIPHLNFLTNESKFNYRLRARYMPSPSSVAPKNYQRLSEEEVIRQLDGVWESQEKLTMTIDLKPQHIQSIQEYFVSELFPHQRQGIAWMLSRELDNAHSLPPFYEVSTAANGRQTYFHALLRHDFDAKPMNIQGGMLCDDMGLGKTIMTLGVIIANHPNPAKLQRYASSSTAENPTPATIGPTLIVCPVSVINSWQDQVLDHLRPDTIKVLLYHGSSRSKSTAEIIDQDIVITSYQTLAQEHLPEDTASGKKRKKVAFLESIPWHRVVLDEGHIIRNMLTNAFKACNALSARHRWFVSGTPIHNAVADIQSAVHFLKLEPFIGDPSLFPRYITRPIKNGNFEAMMKLQALMKVLALRRHKRTVETNIPAKEESIVNVELSPAEREAYDAISRAVSDYMSFLMAMSTADAGSNIMSNSSSVLGFITRLRQCCLDFSMVPAESLVNLLSAFQTKSNADSSKAVAQRLSDDMKADMIRRFQEMFRHITGSGAAQAATVVEEEDLASAGVECCICLDPLQEEDAVMFKICKHSLCGRCVDRLFSGHNTVKCPLCRIDVTRQDSISFSSLKQVTSAEDPTVSAASTKVTSAAAAAASTQRSAKTIEIIRAIKLIRSQHPDEKIVIFSSFVSYLNTLRAELTSEDIHFCHIEGSMPQKQRVEQMRRFAADESVPVMLCSLKACGVGITLTRANHIFLADLWWSPAADIQAIDRVHRLGQTRVVHVYRFLVTNSIDHRIYNLQKEKMQMAKMTFDMTREQAREQRLRDIQSLLL